MPTSFNAKVALPSFDEMMKPLVYTREQQDKSQQLWSEMDSKSSLYTSMIERERSINPKSILVQNFDNYKKNLGEVANQIMTNSNDPLFRKKLYGLTSQFSAIAPMFEQARDTYNKRVEEYNRIKSEPDAIIDPSMDPNTKSYEYFYNNPTAVPTAVSGFKLAANVGQTFDILGKQFASSYVTKGQKGYVNIINEQGLKPEYLRMIKEAIRTGDTSTIESLNMSDANKKAILNAINTTKETINNYGFNMNNPELSDKVFDYVFRGVDAATSQISKNTTRDQDYNPIRLNNMDEFGLWAGYMKDPNYSDIFKKHNVQIKDGVMNPSPEFYQEFVKKFNEVNNQTQINQPSNIPGVTSNGNSISFNKPNKQEKVPYKQIPRQSNKGSATFLPPIFAPIDENTGEYNSIYSEYIYDIFKKLPEGSYDKNYNTVPIPFAELAMNRYDKKGGQTQGWVYARLYNQNPQDRGKETLEVMDFYNSANSKNMKRDDYTPTMVQMVTSRPKVFEPGVSYFDMSKPLNVKSAKWGDHYPDGFEKDKYIFYPQITEKGTNYSQLMGAYTDLNTNTLFSTKPIK